MPKLTFVQVVYKIHAANVGKNHIHSVSGKKGKHPHITIWSSQPLSQQSQESIIKDADGYRVIFKVTDTPLAGTPLSE
jgi:hypothetical protein